MALYIKPIERFSNETNMEYMVHGNDLAIKLTMDKIHEFGLEYDGILTPGRAYRNHEIIRNKLISVEEYNQKIEDEIWDEYLRILFVFGAKSIRRTIDHSKERKSDMDIHANVDYKAVKGKAGYEQKNEEDQKSFYSETYKNYQDDFYDLSVFDGIKWYSLDENFINGLMDKRIRSSRESEVFTFRIEQEKFIHHKVFADIKVFLFKASAGFESNVKTKERIEKTLEVEFFERPKDLDRDAFISKAKEKIKQRKEHIRSFTGIEEKIFEEIKQLDGKAYNPQIGGYQKKLEAPDRFVDNGDTTITDQVTGLMWEKEGSKEEYTWNEAHNYAKQCKTGGYSDWRLPTIDELQSILDYSTYDPAINKVFNCQSSGYWSSTTYAPNTGNAWYVGFLNGGGLVYNNGKTVDYFVRCCRD